LGKFLPLRRLLDKACRILLKSGEFDAAWVISGWVVRIWPHDPGGYFTRSALALRNGNRVLARQILERGVKTCPILYDPTGNQPSSRIIRLRGLQNSIAMFGQNRNGDFSVKFRGGNFSDKYLTDKSRFAVNSYFIFEQNLLSDQAPDACDLVLNLIADPDVESASLDTLSIFLSRHPGLPVINAPDRVRATSRDNNYRRLRSLDGILFPRTARMSTAPLTPEDADNWINRHGFRFPVIIRTVGTHTGRSTERVATPEAFSDSVSNRADQEIYVIQYVDGLQIRGHYRKMRVFFVAGEIFPAVCHFDTIWNVHGFNRRQVMARQPWMMENEKTFLSDCRNYVGGDAYRRLQQLAGIIGLDFFGIDFTLRQDGTLVIFEINAAMRHSFDHGKNFPYLNPYLQNITDAFNRMIAAKLARQDRVTEGGNS